LGDKQLERYVDELDCNASTSSTLVVLSRYPVEISSNISNRVVARRWYQIAHWLHDKLEHGAVNDVVNQFLVKQLIDFFEGRNILMEKVGPELVTGMRAFRSLIAMVSEAITARQMTMNKSFARDWAGYYFDREKQDFFLGLYYERPEFLVFETYNFAVVPNAAEKLGIGEMRGKRWEWSFPLQLEEVGFFSFDREQQMKCVAEFLDDSINAANKVRQAN
jgi:hypothetical protein